MDYAGEHTFPIYKIGDIVTSINSMHVPIAEEDLTKPTAQRMEAIYEGIAEILIGVSRRSFEQPPFNAIQALEQPDIHLESLPFVSYFRILRRFMVDIGVRDFSMRDLLRPQPRRVRRCLSAVTNFALYREGKMEVFNACTEKTEASIAARDQVLATNRRLTERLRAIHAQRELQEPDADKLRRQNADLATFLREAKRQKDEFKQQTDELNAVRDELQTSLEHARQTAETLRNEIHRIKGRIVRNPDQLRKAISDMSSSLQGEKASIAATEKRSRDVLARIELFSAVEQELAACLAIMTDCEQGRAQLEQAQAKADSGYNAIDSSQQVIADLNVQLQQLKRRIASSTERIQKLTNHHQIRREKSNARLQALREEYNVAVSENEAAMTAIAEQEQQAAELEDKINAVQAQDAYDAGVVEELVHMLRSQAAAHAGALERSIAAAVVV